MSRARVWRSAGACAVVAGVVAGCTAPPPDVDPRLRKAVQPVVHAALVAEVGKDGGMLGDSAPASKARWFCAEKVVEIREAQDGVLRVGLDMACSELAVRGRTLVEGTGIAAPWVMELSRDGKGGYRVRHQESPPDGAGYDDWIGRSFSEGGAEMVRHGEWQGTATLEATARTHFRLPPEAPVTQL
ncbi:hypothetical protein OG883_12650 [Streptomyces sp. NBC_01142]|uniref:hypothetical protein n=1 Tax=Streptomyces sp. NBC_01142 TaxID=2975865 RepID=UPI002258CECA|nr:hypothetical protein [Streptomyces sp. NBC_01142]MCX4820743.1 hypothetical protein [Streptomyces sp. NBC_01142]